MSYRFIQAIIKVLGEQPGVIANTSMSALYLIHTSAPTFKIKIDSNTGKLSSIEFGGFFNTTLSRILNLAHLQFGYGFNHSVQYIAGQACYNTQKVEY